MSHFQKQPESQAAEFINGCQLQRLGPPSLKPQASGSPTCLGALHSRRAGLCSLRGQPWSLPFQKVYDCFSSLELTWKPSCQLGKVIILKNAGCPKDKQLGPTMVSLCFLGSRVPSPHLQSAPFLLSASFPSFSSPHPYTFAPTLQMPLKKATPFFPSWSLICH